MDRASERYRQESGAAAYRGKYEQSLARRLDNRREHLILAGLLAGTGENITILNAACGAGRFAELLLARCRGVVLADFSLPMLHTSREHLPRDGGKSSLVAANALQLPFGDRSFDLVMAVRLLHHLHTDEQQSACIRELLRVAGRWVILTFADARSLKGRNRRFRQRWFGRKRGEAMLERGELLEKTRSLGFRPQRFVPVSRLFSTQTYALLEREHV